MWNQFQTGAYSGVTAETISFAGKDGRQIPAYYARPMGVSRYPGIVLIPHMPGWDEWHREISRRFAEHGYSVLCPDIYRVFGTGTPEEMSQKARENGGCRDDDVMADAAACLAFLKSQPVSNGKVGVIGMCSGGRHAYLAACTVEGFDAAVDCWGAGILPKPEELTPARPVAAIDYTEQLSIPLLGIFGNDDRFPTPEEVERLDARLTAAGKEHTFYRYDGAGHGFWYWHAPAYRQEQAMDSWEKVDEFFTKHLHKEE